MNHEAKFSGLSLNQRVLYSGYEGIVIRFCEWSHSMIEVRLRTGVVCVSSQEVLPLMPATHGENDE